MGPLCNLSQMTQLDGTLSSVIIPTFQYQGSKLVCSAMGLDFALPRPPLLLILFCLLLLASSAPQRRASTTMVECMPKSTELCVYHAFATVSVL